VRKKFGGTQAQIRSALTFYKWCAWISGTFLLLLVLEMISRYVLGFDLVAGGTEAASGKSVALGVLNRETGNLTGGVNISTLVLIIHGWFYVIYLVSCFRIWLLMRWGIAQFIVMALGGVVICLVSAVAVALPLVFVSDKPFAPHLSPGMWWHILTSIAAWTFISLAFLHAALYGWLFRRLKRKQLKDISVSSLVSLERVMMLQAVTGFILLAIALLTGWMFVDDLFAQHLVHKTVLTLLAWLALGWMLFSYYIREQRGLTLVLEMCAAFILLLTGYVLSNVILQFILNH